MISKIKQLIKQKSFIKYFKNTSWLFGEKILRMIVGLFVGIWVARYLGPENFGLFSYAQSFVGIFSAVAMMGLNALVIKEIVENKKNLNKIMGTAFILKLLGSFIVFFLLFISMYLTNNSIEINILIFIIAFGLIAQSFNVIEFYFQSQVISQYIVYSNIISLFISSITKIIFILNGVDLLYFAILSSIDIFILAIGFIYFYKKQNHLLSLWQFDIQLSKKFLHDGWPLILSGMSFVIYNNIDKIMLQNMLNSEAVGIYTSATRLTMLWQFIPGLIVTSFMPSIVQEFNKNQEEFLKKLQYLASFLIWFSIIVAIVYSIFPVFIINITFGSEYKEASSILIILIWANIFIFFNTVWNRWKLIEGNTKITFYFSLSTSLFNIVFNYFFIKIFGIIGASYAILLALSSSYLIFYIIIDSKVIKLFFKALFFKKGVFNENKN